MPLGTEDQDPLDTVHQYFEAWNNQDITKLSELVSDNIKLTDWNMTANGREEFLIANANIFNDSNEIKAHIVKLFRDQTQVIAQLKIQLTHDTDKLDVIDHFEMQSGKIIKIKAYRGF